MYNGRYADLSWSTAGIAFLSAGLHRIWSGFHGDGLVLWPIASWQCRVHLRRCTCIRPHDGIGSRLRKDQLRRPCRVQRRKPSQDPRKPRLGVQTAGSVLPPPPDLENETLVTLCMGHGLVPELWSTLSRLRCIPLV